MGLENGVIFKYDDTLYMVIESINDNNNVYYFVNQMNGDDPTEDFYLLKDMGDDLDFLVDEKEIDRLFIKVQEKLKEDLEGE